jgi:hypothetical protein
MKSKLFYLLSFLKKSSLKESKDLNSLIKESGYGWEEMGKLPNTNNNVKIEEQAQPKIKKKIEEESPNIGDSWLGEDLNWNDEGDVYRFNPEESDEEEKDYKIDDSILKTIKESFMGEDSYSIFCLLINYDDFAPYAKIIAREYPMDFLHYLELFKMEPSEFLNKGKSLKDINQQNINECKIEALKSSGNIDAEELIKRSRKIGNSFGDFFESIIYDLNEYKIIITKNEKLLKDLIEKEPSEMLRFFLKKRNKNLFENQEDLISISVKKMIEKDPIGFVIKYFNTDIVNQNKDLLAQRITELAEKEPKNFVSYYQHRMRYLNFMPELISKLTSKAEEKMLYV